MLTWIADLAKAKGVCVENFSTSFEDVRVFSAVLDAVDTTFTYEEVWDFL